MCTIDLVCIGNLFGIEPLECGYLEPPRTGGAYKTNMQAYKNHRDQLTPGVAEFLMTTVSRWAGDLLHGPPSTNGTDRSLYLVRKHAWNKKQADQLTKVDP